MEDFLLEQKETGKMGVVAGRGEKEEVELAKWAFAGIGFGLYHARPKKLRLKIDSNLCAWALYFLGFFWAGNRALAYILGQPTLGSDFIDRGQKNPD